MKSPKSTHPSMHESTDPAGVNGLLGDCSKALTDEFLGIIYVDRSPLEKHPEIFTILDYFLDGLLSLKVRENSLDEATVKENRSQIYFGKNFGNPLMVGVLRYEEEFFKKDLINILTLAPKDPDNRHKILFMSKKGLMNQDLGPFAKGALSHLKFEYLVL